jgi:hypothetical protein
MKHVSVCFGNNQRLFVCLFQRCSNTKSLGLGVSGFVVVVHVWNWMTLSLVHVYQKMQQAILLSNGNKLGFVQMNLRMSESLGTEDAIQEVDPNEINIPKVPSRSEVEDRVVFLV